MGKGCSPRPYSVTRKKYDDNYDAIFSTKKKIQKPSTKKKPERSD